MASAAPSCYLLKDFLFLTKKNPRYFDSRRHILCLRYENLICAIKFQSSVLDFEIQNLFSWDQLFKFLLKVATLFVITKIFKIKTQEEYLQTQQDHLKNTYVQITHGS